VGTILDQSFYRVNEFCRVVARPPVHQGAAANNSVEPEAGGQGIGSTNGALYESMIE
jgi:hypothetical protein